MRSRLANVVAGASVLGMLAQGSAASPAVPAQDPVGILGARVEGALGSFRASAGWETTDVDAQLGAGESLQLPIPLLARKPSMALSMGELEDAADRVRWTESAVTWPAPWSALPYSLQGRSLPPVESALPGIAGLHWAWLGMSLLLVAALHRKPKRAFVLGAALAGTLFLLPSAPPAEAPRVTLLEGDADSGRWLLVQGAEDRLVIDELEPGWLRRLPSGTDGRLELRHDLRGSWAARFAGTRLYYLRETTSHPNPGLDGPGPRTIRRAWWRRAGEAWGFLELWEPGRPLPEPDFDGPSPPGWLAAGLPQGVGVLLGETETESGETAWIRLVGFDPEH